jgi:hypothetical protein
VRDVFEPEQMADLVERRAALHLGRECPAAVIVQSERNPRVADLGTDLLAPRLANACPGK